ncbi:HNH endonuclease [Pseudanabaena sp. Chao 1811]|uniref:HNH endonuclease n=1 Tax=Pseudanabaena sp. Chao 1811 TaxID=2963092 RepID=UPI0022F3FBBE|nr:HNH endonuclease signature motif containing protein [Pseudanabaena sp. Chao 1811]
MNQYYSEVSARANHHCEYCHAPELVFNFPFEVEHIIPISKQGTDNADNLALACRSCNLRKGSSTSVISPNSNIEVRLFNPRNDQWHQHFLADPESGIVNGITDIGKVTVEKLMMNSSSQLSARKLWIRLGLFP